MLREQDGVEAPDEEHEDSSDTDEEEGLMCRHCSTVVSSRRHLFKMRSESLVQVFPNPHGQMIEILTVRNAWGLKLESWGTEDFTWFAGYAWTIAACGECSSHLGWRFDAVRGDEPTRFYGFVKKAVA